MATRVSDGFRHPLGSGIPYTERNDGDGYYSAQDFLEFNRSLGSYHLGEDWNGEGGGNSDLGEPIYAISNGYVTQSGVLSGLGEYIVIAHELPSPLFIQGAERTEIVSLYAHLDTSSRLVSEGDIVTKGQKIGELGNTGYSEFAHLHFEIRLGQEFRDATGYENPPHEVGWVDPTDFITQYRTLASGPDNTPPEVSVPGQSGAAGSWMRLSDILSYDDVDGDNLVALALWDNQGTDSWWADGGRVDASNGHVTSDPSGVYFQFDTAVAAQTLWVTAYDGTEWGKWDAFAVSTIGSNNTPPVVSVSNQTAARNEWLNLGDILSYHDADGDTLQYLGLWDSEGSDSWRVAGNTVDASRGHVTQSDPSDVWFRGDSNAGEQAIWVTGYDGTEWGAWDAIILTTTTEVA